MKKKLLRTGAMLLVSLFILTGCPQEPENLADNGVTLKLEYNPYGPNYQGIGEVVGTKYDFVKDEVVEITVSGKADKDIEELYLQIVDRSEAANTWLTVVGPVSFCISDIKAGEPFEKTLQVTVNDSPKSKAETKITFWTTSVKETVTLSELKYSFKKPESSPSNS